MQAWAQHCITKACICAWVGSFFITASLGKHTRTDIIIALTAHLTCYVQLPLGTKTVAPTALHFDGMREYDAHNLYGLAEARVTAEIVARVRGRRPFILTRHARSRVLHRVLWHVSAMDITVSSFLLGAPAVGTLRPRSVI